MVSLRDDVFIYTAGGGCATRKMKNAGKLPAAHAHADVGMASMAPGTMLHADDTKSGRDARVTGI